MSFTRIRGSRKGKHETSFGITDSEHYQITLRKPHCKIEHFFFVEFQLRGRKEPSFRNSVTSGAVVQHPVWKQ